MFHTIFDKTRQGYARKRILKPAGYFFLGGAMSFPRYERYKDSGVEWLGEVPAGWNVLPLKRAVRLITEKTGGREYAVALENIEGWTGRYIPTDTEFEGEGVDFAEGDILFGKLRPYLAKAWLSDRQGGAVGDFHVLRPEPKTSGRFLLYLILNRVFISIVDGSTFGAKMPRVSWDFMGGMQLPFPPLFEQHTIAAFLDRETAKIDALIAEQQRLIARLAEKRQAVISHAVTKGLDPAAPMKDSGVEWLGEVPAHWTLTRLRRLFRQEKRQNQFCKPVLSVYRDYGVILKDSRDDNMNKTPDDLSAYQLVNPSDLVVNKMKAWQGSLGVSDLEGITSPDYVVFTPRQRECSAFLHLLLRSQRMVTIYRSISNGIRPSQWRLEPDLFLGLSVFLPPMQEQRNLVSFITDQTSRFDALIAEAQSAIALLQERRTALISAAVTGKIDVRGAI